MIAWALTRTQRACPIAVPVTDDDAVDPLAPSQCHQQGVLAHGQLDPGLVEHLRGPVRPRRQQVLERLAQDTYPWSAEHDLERLVDPHHGAFAIDHDQPVGQRFDERVLAPVDFVDALLEALSGRDVPQGHDDSADRVEDVVGGLQLEVDLVAVGPTGAELQRHRQSAAGHQIGEQGSDLVPVFRVEQAEGVGADRVAHVVAEQPLGRCTHEHEAPVRGHHGHHVGLVDRHRTEVRAAGEGEIRVVLRLEPVPRFPVQAEDGVDHVVVDDSNVPVPVRSVAIGRQFGDRTRLHGRRRGPRVVAGVGIAPALPARAARAVGPAHAATSTGGRSASHRGWKTCHCSGARRIRPSRRVAISWVRRTTSARSEPDRVVSSGGSTRARWSRPGPL